MISEITDDTTENGRKKFKCWENLVKLGNHFTGELGLHAKLGAIETINEKLSPTQLERFKNTCFWYFLNMQPFIFHNQLLHSLFLRKVYYENGFVFWIKISGKLLRFGIDEFALVTGLKCIGEFDKRIVMNEREGILHRCFDSAKSVDWKAIFVCM